METNQNLIVSNDVDMSILIVSYDGYSDLWEDFFYLLNTNWRERKYPTYLANNTMKADFKKVHVVNCGEKAEWSTRVRIALNQIDTEYVCLLVEDYFIGEDVKEIELENILRFIKSEGIKYYKFKMDRFSTEKGVAYKKSEFLHIITDKIEYGISLQPAIWDKEYLLDLIGDGNYSAWKFELNQVDKLGGTNTAIDKHVFDNRNVMNICHVVVQGKILPSAITYFNKRGYEINTFSREIMSISNYRFYNMKRFVKRIITLNQRKIIKKILIRFGVKFVSSEKR